MTFKIKTKIKFFKAVVSALSFMTEEAVLKVEQDKIICKTMDPSHYSQLSLIWPKTRFEEFEASEDHTIGFRVDDMNSVVKRFTDKDADVTISMESKEPILKITSNEKTFELKILADSILPNIPDELKVDYNVTFDIPIATFNEYLKDIKVMSEFVKINAHENKLSLECWGDSGRAKVNILDNVQGEAKSWYNLDLMTGVLSSFESFVEKATMSFGEKRPLRVRVYFFEDMYINFFVGHMDREN